MTIEGKRQSIPLTEGPSRAAARSYLRGAGFKKEDLHKPIIGVANTWTEIGTCNVHLRDIAEALKQGIREAGGTPMEFNTVTISDGITMGTQGMKASLVSRELIADSIELAEPASPETIHLIDWPIYDDKWINDGLEAEMNAALLVSYSTKPLGFF